MAGIVFVRTTDLAQIGAFYMERIGMRRWVSQTGIEILQHENLLVGFQQADRADTDSLITFFYPSREQVDALYARLSGIATSDPRENISFRIYNFFARDPDGRRIEFQTFLHALPPVPGAG